MEIRNIQTIQSIDIKNTTQHDMWLLEEFNGIYREVKLKPNEEKSIRVKFTYQEAAPSV